MNSVDIKLLFDYNEWANHKILDCAAHLSAAQLTEAQSPGFSPGTFKKTLVHTMSAEWLWRMRCQHASSPRAILSDADYPTLASIAERWLEEARQMRDYVASIHDAQLAHVLDYNSLNGDARQNTLEHCLTHVVFHGMQHRGECAVLLTNYGFSPGNIDLLYYFIEKGTP